MSDPGVRNLSLLEKSASTARVLNLRAVAISRQNDPDFLRRPFFQLPILNRSLIVKHRLRRNELELFSEPRSSATKVLMPIDHQNLRAGAKFFFIGQREYQSMLEWDLGLRDPASHDMQMLAFLDEIPSFDPFLLREQLRRRRFDVAPCYFNVSAADTARMLSFAQAEIQPLVDVAFSNVTSGAGSSTLAQKLLSNADDVALQPLREVMHLDAQKFAECMFCWKAFLYYKWKLTELMPSISEVTAQVAAIRPVNRSTQDLHVYLQSARANIQEAVSTACRHVSQTLRLYDIAYNGLVRRGDGRGFRDFLLQAPARFTQLGEELAAVDHIISFWRYRFPRYGGFNVTADELATIFHDFESGLRIQPKILPMREPATRVM
jgi:hypothetical protein